jgi:hypothetical protein
LCRVYGNKKGMKTSWQAEAPKIKGKDKQLDEN